MMERFLRRAAALCMAAALALTATGCWGKHELTELFFVTGVAIDTSDIPGEYVFSLQVSKTQAASSGKTSGGSGSSEKAALILSATEKTMSEAINTINRDASRKVFIHHNQIILFSEDLAREGLVNHIDIFMRDQESRMEVPVAIVEGKAADILSAEMEQDKVTGSYLARTFDSRASISPNYKVTILDFASKILDTSVSAVVPLLKMTKNADQYKIEIDGMAVLKNGKMIGSLDNEAVYGYIWAMGDIKNGRMAAESDQGRAVFQIESLESAWKVEPRKDGGVKTVLTVNANLLLDEMVGFTGVPQNDLVKYLKELGTSRIKNRIVETFETTRAMDADIYKIGVMLHQHHKTAWHAIADDWDAQYQNIDFEVRVSVQLPSTGKVIQSVEMEKQQ
jgi:spore germination protein KC